MDSFVILLSYMAFTSINDYKLIKKAEFTFLSNIDNIKSDKVKMYKKNVNYNKNLDKYIDVIKNNTDKSNLFNMYNNLESLKVIKDNKVLLKLQKACYIPSKNEIRYQDINTLGHEFTHLCSANIHDGKEEVGLSTLIDNSRIGNGINEGYTDLLARRNFNKSAKAYNEVVNIASKLEQLIGKENMMSYYYNNDLEGFIKHLQNYFNNEEIASLFAFTDGMIYLKIMANPYVKILEKKAIKRIENKMLN